MIQNSRKLSELNSKWRVLSEGDDGLALPPLPHQRGEDFEINYGINEETVAKLLIGITVDGEYESDEDPDAVRGRRQLGSRSNFIVNSANVERIIKVIQVFNPIDGEPITNQNITIDNFKQLVGQDLFKFAETGLLLNEEGTGPISQEDLASQIEYLHKNSL